MIAWIIAKILFPVGIELSLNLLVQIILFENYERHVQNSLKKYKNHDFFQ